ncbi:MAG TPA: DUF1572 family protein [Ignavibacteria bacterium]|nr:DUF1572 family protein [Ignavibacteria bacterium]
MTSGENFLKSSIKEFEDLKKLGDKSFSQIKDEDFFFQPDEETNSIAIIIRHISGNMLSRWTDFLTSDGEKEWRKRDEEFEKLFYTDKDDIIERWEKGWKCVFDAVGSLTPDDLMKTIYIRSQPHTVIEAITRQLTHYGYHVGQIVYMAKHLARNSWGSLSIPRGKSAEFNSKMEEKYKK